MNWFLLDHKDKVEKEEQNGFSMFENIGERNLEERPFCSLCGSRIWPLAVTEMSKIKFISRNIGDLAWNYGNKFIVTEHFINCWINENMRGLDFSETPLKTVFKKKSVFKTNSKQFHIALPEPIITRFTKEANAVYEKKLNCLLCQASRVIAVEKIIFEEGTIENTDCCIPSCLPGWVAVNNNFLEFVEKNQLSNLFFMEGFKISNRETIKIGARG